MARLTIGAPGNAGPAGVPAADDQGPAAELLPVFAALASDVESSAALGALLKCLNRQGLSSGASSRFSWGPFLSAS